MRSLRSGGLRRIDALCEGSPPSELPEILPGNGQILDRGASPNVGDHQPLTNEYYGPRKVFEQLVYGARAQLAPTE